MTHDQHHMQDVRSREVAPRDDTPWVPAMLAQSEPWRFWPAQHSCGGWKEVEEKERLAKRLRYFETRERLWNDGHPGN